MENREIKGLILCHQGELLHNYSFECFGLPVDCHCLSIAVVMSHMYVRAGNNTMMWPNAIACGKYVAKLFSA